MNFTTYFIKHPVTSLILNGMIVLLGLLCFNTLPVREYPAVNFPTITIKVSYPNASAQLVESSVTNIIEGQLTGIAGVEKIVSYSMEQSCWIEIEFNRETLIDQALIMVRDAIGLARSKLPNEVREPIVERRAKSDGIPFMAVAIESSSIDFGELTHYTNLNLRDAFRSLKGVASAEVWGQPYTYSITLNPKKMYSFGVNADEIFDAIKNSSLSLPAGKFQNKIPVTIDSSLQSIEDYKNLIIKKHNFNDPLNHHNPILLQSIANITLQTNDKQMRVRINGNPGLCIAINKTSDANPLNVSDIIHSQVIELQQTIPPSLKINVIIDQAAFIRSSVQTIKSSILEAIICVVGIIFIFLRNVRATLIPLITIPISLIGSLLFLKLFGFSLNVITLLAIVLAIGLVVDDAIVVLENITRHIEQGLRPLEAAIKGSKEIGFAIIAMTLTLTNVYIPIIFIQGTIGKLFIEFAAAIAGSVLISGIVSLTLSPLMCTKILSSKPKYFWPQFDLFFTKLSEKYGETLLLYIINYKNITLFLAVSSIALIFMFFKILPGAVAPKEDRGLIGISIPPAVSQDIDRLETNSITVENIIKSIPEIKDRITFISTNGSAILMPLKPLADRKLSAVKIVDSLRPQIQALPLIDAWVWSWDSGLPGIEISNSSTLAIVISTIDSYKSLFDTVEQLREMIDQQKIFASISHDLQLDSFGFSITLDNNKLAKLNLTSRQIAKMIEIFFSGDQSLTFTKDGIFYPILLKGSIDPWTLNELYVTNPSGKPISIGTVAKITPKIQPRQLVHYNQMRSTTLKAELRSGERLETSMQKLGKILDDHLPATYKKTWTGAAKVYKESSITLAVLLILALIFIYSILAIQFENFIDPLIILFTVPLAASGALFTVWATRQSLNIYTQIGLITLIGLISKHGILIVEFANHLRKELPLLIAIQKAAILRLRPILMTTAAMIFGTIPLALSHNAGAESRHAIATVLLGGLSFGTLFTLFIIPTLYYIVKSRVLPKNS